MDVLVIRCQSANDATAFRDFTVWWNKVDNTLLWLKANNYYYKDIIIDNKILQRLLKNGSIIDQFLQIQNNQITDENHSDINEIRDELISYTFVPIFLSTH